jgi:tetratricopeptide (TPR) repeat protein
MSGAFRPFRTAAVAIGLSFVLVNAAYAEDWPAIIRELERRPSSPEGKQQLAVAYNNHAMELSNDGQFSEAEAQLKTALKHDAKNTQLQHNLSVVLLNHAVNILQDRRQSSRGSAIKAKALAQQSLRYNRNAAEPYVLLGDIEYDSQQLERAKRAWEKAKRLNPSLPGLDERMQKLQSEFTVEKEFERGGNFHFDLRYQDQIDRSTAFDLRGALDQARRDVGRDFSYWPRRKIVVLIYSADGFSQVRRGPDWSVGLYDGKIRVPFPSNAAAQETVKPTLYHEYTHALIHDITHNKCPVWLNEGIAEHQEARLRAPNLARLQAAVRQDKLIPLTSLDAAFKSRDANVAGLAYQQSYSLVTFLVQKYRFYRIRRVLEAIGNDKTVEEAFRAEFRISMSQLEARWQSWLPGFVK